MVSGSGTPSVTITWAVPPTVPGAPGIDFATAGDGQATVNFAAPTSDGGASVASYTVTALDSTDPANGGQTASGSGSPITVTGLTNGDTYIFSVTATNAAGTGPASAASNSVVPAHPVVPDHLALSPPTATVAAGTATTYMASSVDSLGEDLGDVTPNTNLTIAPDGADTGAYCDSTGHLCTATKPGDYTVTATNGSLTGTAALQVTHATAVRLSLSPSGTTISAGSVQAYTSTGFDGYENSFDTTASTTLAITPNGDGTGASCDNTAHTCTAIQAGTYTVSATDGSASDTSNLTVTPAGLDHLALSPAIATIAAGGSQVYSAEGFDAYNNDLGDMTAQATLSIGPGGSCDNTAHSCSATQPGTYSLTATDGPASGTATLTVTPAGLDHLVLSPPTATVAAGKVQPYTLEGFDVYNNSLGDMTGQATLSIGPGGSCDNSAHSCSATQPGTYTVTGTVGTATSTSTLMVNPGGLDHLILSPAGGTVTAGVAQAYSVTGADAYDNSLGDVTNATTLTIPPDGTGPGASCDNTAHTCTATQADTYTVRATDDTATGATTLRVNPAPSDHLTLSPPVGSVPAGTAQAYNTEQFDKYSNSLSDAASGTTLSITPNGPGTGAWCDNNTKTCTATQAGIYTVTGVNSGKMATAILQVTAAGLDHLSLSPAASSVTAGATQAYSDKGMDQYGNVVGDATSATTLTITPNGAGTGAVCNNTAHTCTATRAGTYTVTGISAGKTAKATLTIVPRFTLRPGLATAISVGRNGAIWILGTKPVNGNYGIYHWNGKTWASVAGGAARIAVDPAGNPWIVNAAHHISHWNGKGWIAYPGTASDIGVGAHGSLWILGTNPAGAGNYGIYHWNGKSWTAVPGGAVRIAVDSAGNPWIINSAHRISHWTGKAWASSTGTATEIAFSANGSVWALGTTAVSGGYQILLWNGSSWTQMPGGAVRIAGGPSGNPWIVNSAHRIYSS
jgi:hypothetical protein